MDGWTVRLIAGITLTLAGAAAGRALAASEKKRVAQLNLLCQAVERLRIAMLDRRLPLAEALKSAGHEAFAAVAALLEDEGSVEAAWKRALGRLRDKSGALSALREEDIAVIGGMFASLGSGRAAEEKLLLSDTREALQGVWQKASQKADEQTKLYSTLGLLTGLAVAVLLI